MGTDKNESAGINAIEDYFFICKAVDTTYIKKGDRGPEWDGDLLLYKDERRDCENLIGRIPIQAKGLKREKLTNSCKFKLSITSLKNYLEDGGLIFFVAQFTPCSREKKLFYKRLLPIDIKKILSDAKGHHTYTIYLNPVPEDVEQFRYMLHEFIDDRKKQSSTIDKPNLTYHELCSKGFKKKITTMHGINLHNIFEVTRTRPFYEYAVDNNGMMYPIGDGPVFINILELKSEGTTEVKVGEHIFTMPYRIEDTETEQHITLGESFHIRYPKFRDRNFVKSEEMSINFDLVETTLSARIVVLEFIKKLAEINKLVVFSRSLEFQKININSGNLERSLSWSYRITELLSVLHINKDLVTKDLSDDDYRHLDILYRSFILHERLPLDGDEDLNILFLKISNINFFGSVYRGDDGLCSFIDIFDQGNYSVYYKYGLDLRNTSPYSYILCESPFWPDNIPTQNVVSSYKFYEEKFPDIRQRANYEVVCLINNAITADISTEMKETMLKVGSEIIEWLLEHKEDTLNYPYYVVNKIQIHRHLNAMTEEDRRMAMRMAFDSNIDPQFNAAGWLLLGDKNEFEESFAKLDAKSKDDFINWPIYKLFNQLS